jgi:hypothetical protein
MNDLRTYRVSTAVDKAASSQLFLENKGFNRHGLYMKKFCNYLGQVEALATLYAFTLGSKEPRQVFNVC